MYALSDKNKLVNLFSWYCKLNVITLENVTGNRNNLKIESLNNEHSYHKCVTIVCTLKAKRKSSLHKKSHWWTYFCSTFNNPEQWSGFSEFLACAVFKKVCWTFHIKMLRFYIIDNMLLILFSFFFHFVISFLPSLFWKCWITFNKFFLLILCSLTLGKTVFCAVQE